MLHQLYPSEKQMLMFHRATLKDGNLLQPFRRGCQFTEGAAARTVENDPNGTIFKIVARHEDNSPSEIGIKQGRRGYQKRSSQILNLVFYDCHSSSYNRSAGAFNLIFKRWVREEIARRK